MERRNDRERNKNGGNTREVAPIKTDIEKGHSEGFIAQYEIVRKKDSDNKTEDANGRRQIN